MTMSSEVTYRAVSPAAFWTGWILSLLPGLFLLADAAMKFVKPEQVVTTTVEMGYPESAITPLGFILLACTLLYLFPRTAILGAVLLTGYLGGAVATHVRHQDPAWMILFPVIFGALLWGGLVLREPRLRALVPWRS
jgi:hypothetical protein